MHPAIHTREDTAVGNFTIYMHGYASPSHAKGSFHFTIDIDAVAGPRMDQFLNLATREL